MSHVPLLWIPQPALGTKTVLKLSHSEKNRTGSQTLHKKEDLVFIYLFIW